VFFTCSWTFVPYVSGLLRWIILQCSNLFMTSFLSSFVYGKSFFPHHSSMLGNFLWFFIPTIFRAWNLYFLYATAKLLFVELENVSRYNKNPGAGRGEQFGCSFWFLISVFGSQLGAFCYGPDKLWLIQILK